MTIIAIRTVIIYIFLIAAMRIMGKRQIGELQPAELVVALVISDLAAIPIQDEEMPLFCGLIPIMILVSLELIVSVVMMKSTAFAETVAGQPVVVIRGGKIDQLALRKLRMTVDDLCEALRQQGVWDVPSVSLAIVEPNGRVSLFTEETPADPSKKKSIPLTVVSDGKLCPWGIRAAGLTKQWVNQTVKRRGLSMKKVLLMTADADRRYTIVEKEDVH